MTVQSRLSGRRGSGYFMGNSRNNQPRRLYTSLAMQVTAYILETIVTRMCAVMHAIKLLPFSSPYLLLSGKNRHRPYAAALRTDNRQSGNKDFKACLLRKQIESLPLKEQHKPKSIIRTLHYITHSLFMCSCYVRNVI